MAALLSSILKTEDMARLLLGRKRTTLALSRSATRLCPVCGQMRPVADFLISKKRRSLNIFCNECKRTNKDGVRRFLSGGRPASVINRKQIIKVLRELARRRISKREGIRMTTDEYALKAAKLPDRVAAIVGKTYAEQGDAAQLADDEALMMIRDLLIELDETLIPRNKNKRLSRR